MPQTTPQVKHNLDNTLTNMAFISSHITGAFIMKKSPINISFLEELGTTARFYVEPRKRLPSSISGKVVTAKTLARMLRYADRLTTWAIQDLYRAAYLESKSNKLLDREGREAGTYIRPWLDSCDLVQRSSDRDNMAYAINLYVRHATAV